MLSKWFLHVAALFAVLLLASCGPGYSSGYPQYEPKRPQYETKRPQYETRTVFIEPESFEGRLCVNQCEELRQSCRQLVVEEHAQCQRNARQEAKDDFQDHLQRARALGKKPWKTRDDFDRSASCRKNFKSCQVRYRACFKRCGGELQLHEICTANCD